MFSIVIPWTTNCKVSYVQNVLGIINILGFILFWCFWYQFICLKYVSGILHCQQSNPKNTCRKLSYTFKKRVQMQSCQIKTQRIARISYVVFGIWINRGSATLHGNCPMYDLDTLDLRSLPLIYECFDLWTNATVYLRRKSTMFNWKGKN